MSLVSYEKGEILLVYLDCRGYHNTPADGFPVRFIRSYEGNEDLSYHGSPWYETFIEAENLKSGKIEVYGDQTYRWTTLDSYLKIVKQAVRQASDLLKSI